MRMLDVYRFVLAVLVVQGHLLAAGQPALAWQAVFSFYVLSGFLMTLVLNEVYGFGAGSFARFLANRVLRLYPAYYAVLLVTVLFIFGVSPANQLNGALGLPQTAGQWLANLSLVGLVGIDESQVVAHRLVPTAWSLTIEIFCYALLAAFFARSVARLLAMLGIGLAIAAAHFGAQLASPVPDHGFFNHYTVLQAGLIPFAVGGLAYFYRHSSWCKPSGDRIGVLCVLLVVNAALVGVSDFHCHVSGLYIVVVLNLFLIPMLFSYDQAHGKRSWQVTLGGMAYPLFMSHWLVGTVVLLMWSSLTPKGTAHFLLSVMASVLVSWALHSGVDRNVEKLRIRLKRGSAPVVEQAWAGRAA